MKIQQTQNLQLNSKKQNNIVNNKPETSFTGGEAFIQILNFLDTNQTMGATVVDAGCMGIPRTTVDFSRGSDAGLETMRREFSSTINNALIGVYGLGAAWLFSNMFNKEFGIKAHKIFVSDELLEILGQIRNNHGNIQESDAKLNSYLAEIFENARGFNPEHFEKSRIDEKGWVNIDKKTQKDAIDRLINEFKKGTDNMSKETEAYLKALISDSTGSEKIFKIQHGNLTSTSSLEDLIDNVYKVSKTFMSSKVSETFTNTNLADNTFIKGLKKLNKGTAILGLALSTAIGLAVQPVNMYLTKKKTGKTGFVGVKGREPDKSNKFKLLKLAFATLATFGVLKSIGKFSSILSKVQFKGVMPTIDQFKLVYGATVASRLLSARDKNELRETSIKDSLGFVNWLILGGFVSKLAASGFEKMAKFKNDKFIRYNVKENGGSWFNWLTKSSIVTREEVLHSALKKAGVSTIKSNGVAMTFKEMLKAAAEHAPEARTKIKYLGLIQFAGYLYSGIVLGVGIPKLNIAITNHFEKKRRMKENEAETKVNK